MKRIRLLKENEIDTVLFSVFEIFEYGKEKENWNIEWRENTKRVIILFTDEEPQSYLVPKLTQSDVIDSMKSAPEFSFYVFSAGFGNVYWDNIVDSLPKAKKFDLVPTAEQMYSNLLDILDETACDEN